MKNKCNLVGHAIPKDFKPSAGYTWAWVGCSRCGEQVPSDDKWSCTYWTSDDWETLSWGLKFFGSVLTILAVAIAIACWGNISECNAYADLGVQTRWNFWTGCMALNDQFGWFPIEEFFRSVNLNIR